MLQRVVRILGTVVSPIVVVAAREQSLPPLPDSISITRDEREAKGPLEGIRAGLSALPESIDSSSIAERMLQRMPVFACHSSTCHPIPAVRPMWSSTLGRRSLQIRRTEPIACTMALDIESIFWRKEADPVAGSLPSEARSSFSTVRKPPSSS